MKKILSISLYAFLLIGFFTTTSCTKEPLLIPYNFGDREFCLPANPFQAYQTYTFDVSHADIVAAMSAAGITDVGRATKAGLKAGFKVKISGTAFTNLDQISNVEVYMKETGTGGTGTQVAYSDNIAAGATEVLLLINGVDLKLAVTKDITLTVKILNKAAGNTAGCVKLTDGIIEVTVRN